MATALALMLAARLALTTTILTMVPSPAHSRALSTSSLFLLSSASWLD
jgi:hypothetical protein